MHHIRSNAETSVRNLLRQVVRNTGKNVLHAIDYLDDGSPVSEMKQSLSRCINNNIDRA
jgi:5-oxoprolinase (ATP-hydrolysing)